MEETRRSCTAPPLQESPLFPFMRQQFSAAPGANTLCSISPHLLCASAAPCHKTCSMPLAAFQSASLPRAPFFFQPFPTSSALHTQVSLKQACSLAFPKGNLPTSTAPDSTWLGSWTTSTIHTYLEFVHPIFLSHVHNVLENHQRYCLLQTGCRKLLDFLKRFCHPFSSVRKLNAAFFLTAFL